MRFLCHTMCLVALLLTLSASWATAQQVAEWEATVTVTNVDDPEILPQILTFGADPSASDGFDLNYDIVLPPPAQSPIGLDTAFRIIDIFPRLSRDIKLKGDANQWQLDVLSETGQIRLDWDIAGIPTDKCAFLQNGETIINMRTQNSLVLSQGGYSLTLEVLTSPDLAVNKTVNDSTPYEGDTITYTVTVINNGPNTATGVEIADQLPSGVTYSSSMPDQGVYDSGTGVWSVGSLANSANAALTITATVDSGAGGGTITNTASVTNVDQADSDDSNDSDSADISPPANNPPVADAGGIYIGEPGEEIVFDGSGSYDADGDPLTYSWTFGDGGNDSGMEPSHIYAGIGTYSVSLVVNDGQEDSAPSTTTAYIYYQGETQQAVIELETGWNLISIWVHPFDNSPEFVLASIFDDLDSIWTYDAVAQEWLRYVVDGSPFFNNLNEVVAGVGYWVKVKQPATLIVHGTEPETAIVLKAGLNLVGYNSDIPRAIADCISSIECNAVSTYDPDQAVWLRCFPYGPTFLNNLETMNPGSGYMIDVETECTWDIVYP